MEKKIKSRVSVCRLRGEWFRQFMFLPCCGKKIVFHAFTLVGSHCLLKAEKDLHNSLIYLQVKIIRVETRAGECHNTLSCKT